MATNFLIFFKVQESPEAAEKTLGILLFTLEMNKCLKVRRGKIYSSEIKSHLFDWKIKYSSPDFNMGLVSGVSHLKWDVRQRSERGCYSLYPHWFKPCFTAHIS